MNHIGKLLVLLHTGASLVALGWAAGVFFQFTDWGWKEPRKDLDVRIASEFDKRAAAIREALKARDLIVPGMRPAQLALRDAENSLGVNHIYYVRDLAELRTAAGDLEIKEVKFKGGTLELDTKNRPTGKPLLGDKIDGINKSFAGYVVELKKLQKEIDDETRKVREETEKVKDITFALTGKDDAGMVVKTGLYALLENENIAQANALSERDYELRPKWASARNEAQQLRSRTLSLERRNLELTNELKKAK